MAQRFPSFGYMVYFASEQSTAEIDAHVRKHPFEMFASTLTFSLKLPLFLRLAFITPRQTKIPLTRMGEYQKYLLGGKEPDRCILNDKVTFVLVPDYPFVICDSGTGLLYLELPKRYDGSAVLLPYDQDSLRRRKRSIGPIHTVRST